MMRAVLVCVSILSPFTFHLSPLQAQDVQFQDIHYTVDENHLTAEVAANPKASGELLIPEKIVVGQNTYTVHHNDLNTVKATLDELRPQCDILVVSFHGGAEGRTHTHLPYGHEFFLGEDRGDLRTFAHFCIDNGADVVYGHGPHVVRCMEVYNGRFIAYSLGNFCTPYGMNLTGVTGYAPVVEIKIAPDGQFLEGQIYSFIQQKGKGPRRDDTNTVAREIRNLTLADIKGSPITISETGQIGVK